MPVACASAPRGGTAPANAATSTATSRRMLVSLPRFRGCRETGTHPAGHSFPFPKSDAARPQLGRAATDRAGNRVRNFQADSLYRTKADPSGQGEPVRDVAFELPVMCAHTGGHAGEEEVERDDAIERRLGKQGLQREHAPAADPEIDIAAPVELQPERRAIRAGGRGTGRRAPLSRELCRGQPDGGEEQDTADQLPHTKPPREE